MPSAQTDRFVHDRLPPPDQWPELRYELPELQQIPAQLNVVQALFDRAVTRGHADRPFLRSDERTLSYAQARAEVNRIANVLTRDMGLVPGNRVLLRGGNSVAMALAWLAVVQSGLIAVATMPLLRATELKAVIDKALPSAALCDVKLQDELKAALAQRPETASLPLRLFNTGDAAVVITDSLEALAKHASDQATPCPTSADDIALLAFTSGTTGRPKAAVHTHRDLIAACETWPRHVLRATPDDIVMGSPPLAFTFGLGGLLVFPMWAGASVYFPGIPYTPEAMVKLIGQVGATICYTAPTFYRQMAAFAKQHGVGKLRISVSAGEGLPDATRQLWKEASGLEMLDGIGATEMFHIFISSPPEAVRRGAIGQVVPGYRAKIVDENGQELPPGQVGRLAVVGPTGCKYLDDARQAQYVKDGWNFPGDAFSQDADGYFFYQARTDDMIITAGYNVAGPEVEASLLLHPAVAECGVVGRPDDERGMVIVAYVVLKPGEAADAAQVKALQDHVKHTLAPYKYPRDVVFVDKLPRTETGKLQRFALRQQAST
ncbi:MAG: 2-aminobenzoate-CoA ligase [Burkholderiales bacterium RIFCSPLOWO2_12_67_14]|nr:MAG: 2-aminobenzoate-CoA ligase [Burkholderiales bacterium RIFCSPLOWO2_02_FULL_67_64]OGB36436.1 MAG: 2-aminobenzoate-CoA ligase [Burkholderiales bacterium RIFCSPHIGHO2_12_FULL_67_38]OGB43511.1 MAG: 2-aminobenzoate-CoA ligase [Burkholderiales bacterium RIFCSPLOWO2_12_67_14]OGB86177.1 MAG: 2-aminobenzoate-CoA ligase [Burkholderiales bacterium RIFCSPLOWO2_12_FULL_67_210]